MHVLYIKNNMNIRHILFASTLAALCMTSCLSAGNSAKETDSGEDYKTFETGEFKELIASDVEVYVAIGEPTGELRLEAAPSVINDIEVENRQRSLSINDRNDKSGKEGTDKAKAYITVGPSQLHTIIASAGAEIILQQPTDAEIFETDAMVSISPGSF